MLTLAGTLAIVLSAVLVIQKRRVGHLLSLVGNILFFLGELPSGRVGVLFISVIFGGLAVYGFISWGRKPPDWDT